MENYFQQTLPIYVFGDSHVLPLKNCIFKDELTDKWIVTKSKYISGLTAHDFYNIKNEEFHSEFINALEYEGLIRNNKACHLSYEEIDFNIFKASNQPVISPLIFLTMGDIDIRLIILPMFKDKFDFIPPFFNPYPKSNKPNLLWDMVADTMNTRIKPFIEGIKSLKTAGFNRIYVQLISPPTMDEENFHKRHGYECPFNIRYKVVYAFNKLLSEQCSVLGVNVIDVWPYVTDNDYLKPDLEFDGVHLPSHAALLNLNLLLKHAINHQWESVNYIRHELYYRMACNTNVFEKSENRTSKNKLQPGMNIPPRRCNDKAPKTDPQFNENWINEAIVSFQNDGICKLKIDLDKIKEWRNILPFDRDVGNLHSAWDWAGNS
ncbi:MAG TPA: hypothetical protein VHM20_03615, partial [Gammaproteobacteria bacterium]|nr:hypothetical protein [Gammaproteobacteria bacterium]